MITDYCVHSDFCFLRQHCVLSGWYYQSIKRDVEHIPEALWITGQSSTPRERKQVWKRFPVWKLYWNMKLDRVSPWPLWCAPPARQTWRLSGWWGRCWWGRRAAALVGRPDTPLPHPGCLTGHKNNQRQSSGGREGFTAARWFLKTRTRQSQSCLGSKKARKNWVWLPVVLDSRSQSLAKQSFS